MARQWGTLQLNTGATTCKWWHTIKVTLKLDNLVSEAMYLLLKIIHLHSYIMKLIVGALASAPSFEWLCIAIIARCHYCLSYNSFTLLGHLDTRVSYIHHIGH